MKKRYGCDVTNILKQVCNVEVVIDDINTNVREQPGRKLRNCTQRKHIYIYKKNQNSESIIMWKNQYQLKKRELETIKRISERIMKEKEEIKTQFDQIKKQHQKDKQKEQQKENEIQKSLKKRKY